MENNELKWHQNPNTIIVLLILVFPLGLYFMWKNKLWSNTARLIITGLFGFGIAVNVINRSSNVDPCKCAEFPGKIELIGYDNLSDEDKKIFSACEAKYETTTDAMNACIEKAKKK